MSQETTNPSQERGPSFPWRTTEADAFFRQLTSLQLSSGLMQAWHKDLTDHIDESRKNSKVTAAEIKDKELTRNAEAPLLVVLTCPVTDDIDGIIIGGEWAMIKIDTKTGYEIGDCPSLWIVTENGKVIQNPSNLSETQLEAFCELIELQQEAGLPEDILNYWEV